MFRTRYKILFLILFFVVIFVTVFLPFLADAHAHPIDRDFSLPTHLNPNNSEAFETCHDDYWHERRELFSLMKDYALVGGDIHRLLEDLGLARVTLFTELLNYPNVVPAHPVIDQPGDIGFCLEQLKAAVFTRNQAQAHLDAAYLYRDFLLWIRG